jgi:hypothetical protein
VGWDRGYYYRSTRKADQPRREYVGKGLAAELASELDALQREQRHIEAAVRQAERKEVEALDRPLDALGELADLAARAALLAAGAPLTGEDLPALGALSEGPLVVQPGKRGAHAHLCPTGTFASTHDESCWLVVHGVPKARSLRASVTRNHSPASFPRAAR